MFFSEFTAQSSIGAAINCQFLKPSGKYVGAAGKPFTKIIICTLLIAMVLKPMVKRIN